MRRGEFIAGLGATAWPLTARAQQVAMPVIGTLDAGSECARGLLPPRFAKALVNRDTSKDQTRGRPARDSTVRHGGSSLSARRLFSPPPDQRFLYVIDGANHHVWILLRETLEVVDRIGRASSAARSRCHMHWRSTAGTAAASSASSTRAWRADRQHAAAAEAVTAAPRGGRRQMFLSRTRPFELS
jgi:hypothetical protein